MMSPIAPAVVVAVVAASAMWATGGAQLTWASSPVSAATTADQPAPPSSTPPRDLDPERLQRPAEHDSTPGRATGLPLALATVVILAVVVTVVLRARGARRPPTSGQLRDGSGGQ